MTCIKSAGVFILLAINSSINISVNAQEKYSAGHSAATNQHTRSVPATDRFVSNLPGRKLNLAQEAKLTASHKTIGYKIEDAVDGNLKTQWVGEGHPLTWQPTNIIIEFKEPKTIQRVVLVSTKQRDLLAIKDVEIYGWANKTWAGNTPLAVLSNTTEETNTIDFQPVTTKALRIRIRDTYYFHSFPRLLEIEVYEALPSEKGRTLSDAAIADENKTERLILDRAFGKQVVFPRTAFKPSNGYFYYAKTFADTMIASGTDRYGKVKSPMFASIIDMETHSNPLETPENSPGQRFGDRSIHGGNLFHDVMLLQAMNYMTSITGDTKYKLAADNYLSFFLQNCPDPNTGLFPWGEHAYWNFYEEKHANEIHEYLGGVPNSFWERLWKINAKAVQREADGLINHITNLDNFHFDRHADMSTPAPVPRPEKYGGMNYQRHAGFYIGLWTFLYSKTKDKKYLELADKMIAHHWKLRNEKSGLPPDRTGTKDASVASSLALSLSLLESATVLPEGAAKEKYLTVAKSYLDAILRLPHKGEEGKFMVTIPSDAQPETASGTYGEPYVYGYGGGFSADYAALLVGVYRLTKDERALKIAERFADFYSKNNPPPVSEAVYARVYATIIGLFNDLHEITRKPAYLEQSKRYARIAIENLYHNGLYRGTTDIGHYEGSMMVGNLVYNLVWLQALEKKSKVKIEPNYFAR
jgi:hypothetical protein